LPALCGFYITRVIIAASSLAAALLMAGAAAAIGIKIGFLYLLGVLGAGLLGLALLTLLRPSDKANFGLFKYASLYMLGAMIVIAV
jgi:heme O synthase-like polyprenyltransferase